jgi:hypothetical protein
VAGRKGERKEQKVHCAPTDGWRPQQARNEGIGEPDCHITEKTHMHALFLDLGGFSKVRVKIKKENRLKFEEKQIAQF